MRGNWNTALRDRLHAVPADAREIVEAVRTVNADIRQRKDRFEEWDSGSGLTAQPDWIELTDATQSLVSTLTHDDDFTTGLVRTDTTRLAAQVQFTKRNHEISQISVRLDPNEDTVTGANVAKWYCEVHQLYRVTNEGAISGEERELFRLHPGPIEVTAPGAAGQVDFSFIGKDLIRLQRTPYRIPIIYVFLWGKQSDGSSATNYGWQCDTADTEFTSGGVTVSTAWLILNVNGTWEGVGNKPGGQPDAFPTIAITEGSYAAATATYTSDLFDLTAAPTKDVELVASTDTPDDSTVTTQWRTSTGPDVWTTFVDGDLAGVDNTARGGTDLSAFAATTTYALRATLTPNTDLNRSPRLRALGVREVERWDLDNLVRLEGGEQRVDPVTMQTTPPTVNLYIQRDGIRDYEDLGTRILSQTHIADLEFRIWWGHPDLARSKWLLWDSLWIQNSVGTLSEIQIECFSALDKLVYRLPVGATTGSASRTAYSPENESYEDAWRNIIAEVGIPDRLEGAAPEGTTTISKRVTDSWAKHEMQYISRLDGGCIIGSQGRFKHVDMHDLSTGLSAIIPREDLQTISTTPGHDRRRPILFAQWDYDELGGGFLEERRSVDATALANLRATYTRIDENLDEEMMRWVDTEADADVIASRELTAFATGVIVWTIQTTLAHPYLEIGDRIAAETDTFVAREPYSGNAIRGRNWGIGRIIAADRTGQQFALWLHSYADILSVESTVQRGDLLERVLTIPWWAFEAEDPAVDSITKTGQVLQAGTVANNKARAEIVFPPGFTEVRNIRIRALTGDGANTGTVTADFHLSQDAGFPGTVITVTDTDTAGTWTTSTGTEFTGDASLNRDGSYFVRITLIPTNAVTDARLAWVQLIGGSRLKVPPL